ncbi:MAG: hypothetical protein JOY82_26520 [Streptosporangiaceae bacterium]|nr:hypothetical protein [Streptosporangiaceae bacterium]MBV9858039.1 hypothetical protein [Streptosporangiaceae bacterium]
MTARPASGHGRDDDPAHDARLPDGTPHGADAGGTPNRTPRGRGTADAPGGPEQAAPGNSKARDSRAHAFAQGGVLATAAPCAALGLVLDEVSGPGRACPATTDDELIGLLGRWDAQESWAAAAKLGVVRALIRRHPAPGAEVRPGGLPHAWAPELASQISLELGISTRAAVTVDPEGARKRREEAEREKARVQFWREHCGTAAIAAFGLPADRALEANQNIQNRALAYKQAGITLNMDQLRVLAYLDLLTETDSRDDRAAWTATGDDTADGGAGGQDNGGAGSEDPGGEETRNGVPRSGAGAGLAANINFTIPLATVLHLAERPGEAHGLGPLDPALARDLTTAAAANDRSSFCVTVTDNNGRAIGHGCCRPARTSKNKTGKPGGGTGNRDGPAFTRDSDHGPPGGHGTWTLTLQEGRALAVTLAPIPVTSCDHRLESAGHDPSPTLRHLVQIRDGACDFPPCVRAARRCDFEHAIPYHKGGRTCACNGGPRCRHDHQVKQSPGWSVRQPLPGYHEWITPSGRVYKTEPMRYPV